MSSIRQRTSKNDHATLVVLSDDGKRKFRKVKLSEISLGGWLLSGLSLCLSLTFLRYFFIPILTGQSSPSDFWLPMTHYAQDLMRDLSDPCPRLLSSKSQFEIKSAARGVQELEYVIGMNISSRLGAQDLFTLRQLITKSTLNRLRPSQYHLKAAQRGTLHQWVPDESIKATDLFYKDDNGLERLRNCLAGTFMQDIEPFNVFKKLYEEIAHKLSIKRLEDDAKELVVSGPLIVRGASMPPTINHLCQSRLLVQIAGNSMIYFRSAREEKQMYGMSLSPWLGVHLLPGDALAWYPGTLFIIEPLDTWSLSMVIIDPMISSQSEEGSTRTVNADFLDDRIFVENYVELMKDCHGVWPPTVPAD